MPYVERTPAEPVESFGMVTSIQRAGESESSGVPSKKYSGEELQELTEKIWQRVRRQLRLERERQRGQP